MEYKPGEFETHWQEEWEKKSVYKADFPSDKPKYYVLDMFPYPSGAGLHVGHPLGYIASDIYARYKRHQGFNVLHPMGYDSFGLPAEQYAIQTGRHPAETTAENIERYRKQLNGIGFSFDWSREVRTSSPGYYKFTQWIFLKLFDSWFNLETQKGEPISSLQNHFQQFGSKGVKAACSEVLNFSAEDWQLYSEAKQAEILLNYRLAYRSEAFVNWCPALGTVLANDEVKDGFSERGGHPVVRKKMMQWSLRITAYADRLLQGLDEIDWTESIKEAQRNWIGKSVGAELKFEVEGESFGLEVFTTRPDTLFGVGFLAIAPEHERVGELTQAECREAVAEYLAKAARKSERERMAEVKQVSGVFTGSYAIHPLSGEKLPIWIADYVLAGYGTGAVMGVPGHDGRDWGFAKHFNLPIKEVIAGGNVNDAAYEEKNGVLVNSRVDLDGLDIKSAQIKIIGELELKGIGRPRVQYRLRDAAFGRQRYWGEPIPIYYENGVPKPVKESHLPLNLPIVDAFLPTDEGEPPLARSNKWHYDPNLGVVENHQGFPLETTTMPGWAGSSWYWLRYMDPLNTEEFSALKKQDYWQRVDLYIGGAEHATGHLLYSRFWQKVLKDLGLSLVEEPFNKLINQGMIQGISTLIYRVEGENKYVSVGLKEQYSTSPIHIDVSLVENGRVDFDRLRTWRSDFADSEFVLENGELICGEEVEKMSKRWHNVVNPDDVVSKYGADALRMYEMFLGPLEQHKPWNTNGLSGVYGFLKKFWRLYQSDWTEEHPSPEALKSLHKTIKKVSEDIEGFSFNTSVSAFMICVNELQEMGCNNRAILEPLLILLSPFAPHIAEELWHRKGGSFSVVEQPWPKWDAQHLQSNEYDYSVSFNGKVRFRIVLPTSMSALEVEHSVRNHPHFSKYQGDQNVKKMIVVLGRIVNVVLG